MVIANDVESYVQEFAAELDCWQARIENLRHMIPAASPSARIPMNASILRIESLHQAAGRLLDRSRAVSPEQWMQIHPAITTALRDAQSCYNDLVAAWPQL